MDWPRLGTRFAATSTGTLLVIILLVALGCAFTG